MTSILDNQPVYSTYMPKNSKKYTIHVYTSKMIMIRVYFN